MESGAAGLSLSRLIVVAASCLIASASAMAMAVAQQAGISAAAVAAAAARPRPAVEAILDAFAEYNVVALGEGPHGNEAGHRFRVSLIRHPRFPATVNDIVVEFGTARHQAVMDRYLAGENVPRKSLRRAWQDTTVPGPTWDRPIYAQFFAEVRALNATLPAERKIRVWLGDAPIDWDAVRGPADVHKFGVAKDGHDGELVKREVLAKGRKALIIFGDGHLQGRGFAPGSLTNVLERPPDAVKIFAIAATTAVATVDPKVKDWRVPSLARVRGTTLGRQPYARFYQLPPAPGWSKVTLEDQFDAVLYLGPPSTDHHVQFPVELCDDAAYMQMRYHRLALAGGPVGTTTADTLKRVCAIHAETSRPQK